MTRSNTLLLHYSHFDPYATVAHGGVLRTRQITQLLYSLRSKPTYLYYNSRIRYAPLNPCVSLYAVLILAFLSFSKVLKYAKATPGNLLFSAVSLAKLSIFLFLRLGTISQATYRIVLWESNVHYNFASLLLLKKLRFKIIALPHNVESLVPGKVDNYLLCDPSGSQFQSEIYYFSLCDYLLPISELDCRNISNLRLPTQCLPYIPHPDPCSLYEAVYQNRSVSTLSPSITIVVPSTCENSSSLYSARQLLHYISSEKSLSNYIFHFCGKGTQMLLHPSLPQNVVISGYLNDTDYESLLCSSWSLLIYNSSPTGVLTRVAELERTGIPILVNEKASVPSRTTPCLSFYSSLVELPAKLSVTCANPLIDDLRADQIQARDHASEVITCAISSLTE